MFKNTELFNLDKTVAKELFERYEYPWQISSEIKNYILEIGPLLDKRKYIKYGSDVWIAQSAIICQSAYIEGPAIIGENAEIRHCAFIRSGTIIGNGAIVGNSTEIKNSILFDEARAPHFNYVGDSILGYKTHLGAGAITANTKSDKSPILIHTKEGDIETGLYKFGAIVADFVEVGASAVLSPGTILKRNSVIYPSSFVRGVVPENSIYKKKNEIVKKDGCI